MTLIEFILSVAVAGMVVLECVILVELHTQRHTCALRRSSRRDWAREEHEA